MIKIYHRFIIITICQDSFETEVRFSQNKRLNLSRGSFKGNNAKIEVIFASSKKKRLSWECSGGIIYIYMIKLRSMIQRYHNN
jgi:hypothetical protein